MNALLRFCGLSLLVLAAGCEDNNMVPADAGAVIDSGPTKPDLGGKLGAAVAAANSAQAVAQKQGGDQGGPPETGIFPPGGADAALAPSAPPKVEVINEGADPKVQLTLAPTGDEQRVVLNVGVRVGQSGLPDIDFNLVSKIERPKDKKDAAGPLPVVTRVASAEPDKEFASRLPKDLIDGIAKLKGSEIRYSIAPNGVMSGLSAVLAKDADPKFELAFRAMVDVFTLMNVPLPDKPVGAGGFWMATDRSTAFGVPVVRYRVFRVQSIDKDKATLAVDIRQYSAKDELDLGALTGGKAIKLDRFDSQGKIAVPWASTALLPAGDDLSARVVLVQAGQRGAAPLEIAGKTREAEKKK